MGIIYIYIYRVLNAREFLCTHIKSQNNEANEVYGSNSESTILLLSGEKSNCGVILNCNTEIKQILGYSREEVMGNSVQMLIPYKKLKAFHNNFILSYVQDPEERGTEVTEIEILGQDNEGYLVTLKLLPYIVPSIDQGIVLMLFINKRKTLGHQLSPTFPEQSSKKVAIFFLDNKYFIQGFNRKAIDICGLEPQNVNPFNYHTSKKKISIRALYPEIFNSLLEQELFSDEGIPDVIFYVSRLREVLLADVLDYNVQNVANLADDTDCENGEYIQEEFKASEKYTSTERNSNHSSLNITSALHQPLKTQIRAKSFSVKSSLSEKKLKFHILCIKEENGETGNENRELMSISSNSEDWRGYYHRKVRDDELNASIAMIDHAEGSVSGSSSIYIYIYNFVVASMDLQDRIKFVRDFKLSLNENRTPKSVRYVTRIAYILFTFLLCSSGNLFIISVNIQ